ncbi:unnamed protein product [Blepharisma stoltei]|uniref:Uncharacterized protein n=1 Tax=Blepharisma stoltei TaxID=1481888 RepID=A0AAU9K523_9CILI|nr:unnamed protein product [Blepharisma stoltei]
MLATVIFKFHNKNYRNHYNSDCNYLFNYLIKQRGSELYIYDLKTHERTSTSASNKFGANNWLLDSIVSIIKISNSHLFIIGKNNKGYLMDLRTRKISFYLDLKIEDYGNFPIYPFIYYDNCIYIISNFRILKYNLYKKISTIMKFPCVIEG